MSMTKPAGIPMMPIGMAKLIFTDKNFSGRVYELVLEKTTIGRSDQNTLVIRDSSLSSTHCEILMHGPEIIVRDLDSSNGTFVGGVRLNQQSQIKSGQTVRFGSVEARLELDPSMDETDSAEITAVYALGKVLREQRRAKNQPEPGPASMQLDPDRPPVEETQTILIPKPPASTPAPASLPSEKGEHDPEGRSKGKLAALAAVAIIALLLIFWLIWGRK